MSKSYGVMEAGGFEGEMGSVFRGGGFWVTSNTGMPQPESM